MALSHEEYSRYSRHILMDEVGENGQLALKNAKVLVVGAGGLGCPALLYLASAGVGTIGIIDGDVVHESNLQRQIIYTASDIGKPKASKAAYRLSKRNNYINYEVFDTPLTTDNASNIIPKYDIIIDGTDNFAARYLINDACVLWDKPFVHGSLFKFDGQVAVFNYQKGDKHKRSATYRCIFPVPPLSSEVPNCSEVGVLGVLPGIIGMLQATEVIKIILGIGEPLADTLLLMNALTMSFDKIEIVRNEQNWGTMPGTEKEFAAMDYHFLCGEAKVIEVAEISAVELLVMLKNNEELQLIDIRSNDEMPRLEALLPPKYIPSSIPLIRLSGSIDSISRTVRTIIVCQSGNRSRIAVEQFQNEHGYTNLYSLKGGVLELLTFFHKET